MTTRNKTSKTRTFRPRLEALEDRLAPAVYWRPGAGSDLKWSTPANWSGDSVPTSSTDVVLDNSSGGNCKVDVNNAVCASLVSTATCTRSLIIQTSSSLSVDGGTGVISNWQSSGTIDGPGWGNAGTLEVKGAALKYANAVLGASGLTVYVDSAGGAVGSLQFHQPMTNMNAALYPGETPGGTGSPGDVVFDPGVGDTITFGTDDGCQLVVEAYGTVELFTGGKVSSSNDVKVYGTLQLDEASTHLEGAGAGMVSLYTVAALQLDDSTGGRTETIAGNLALNDSSALEMEVSGSSYTTLSVSGSFTLGGSSTFVAYVNLASRTQCDQVKANAITIGANAYFTYDPLGTAVAGNHSYVLFDRQDGNNITGSFQAGHITDLAHDSYTWICRS
jgi:hypothetical protein